jgi:hypothetical protein
MSEGIHPYEGDQLLHRMPLAKMMETVFEETAMAVADSTQPMFSLSIGSRRGFFSRNLVQCFILDLHLELKKRDDKIKEYGYKHVRNGKLVLPLAAAGGGAGASHLVDGVGVCEEDAAAGEGGAA